MPSLEIKVLLLTAFAACVYLFISEIKRGRRTVELVSWVRENHSEEWNSLPWAARKLNHLGGLALLFKRRMISDPHFTDEYNTIKPFRKEQNIAFIIAVSAIALVLLGVKLGYWHW